MEYATDELETLETIDGIKQIGSISKVSKFENSTVKIETVITNTTLTEGITSRQLHCMRKMKKTKLFMLLQTKHLEYVICRRLRV